MSLTPPDEYSPEEKVGAEKSHLCAGLSVWDCVQQSESDSYWTVIIRAVTASGDLYWNLQIPSHPHPIFTVINAFLSIG